MCACRTVKSFKSLESLSDVYIAEKYSCFSHMSCVKEVGREERSRVQSRRLGDQKNRVLAKVDDRAARDLKDDFSPSVRARALARGFEASLIVRSCN